MRKDEGKDAAAISSYQAAAEILAKANPTWGELAEAGVFSLRLLIRILSQRKLHWFAYYCLLVATGTTAWQLWLRMPSGG